VTADQSGTRKLYWEDSFLDTFTATVLEVREIGEETWGVILDQTAFYPEGGGQPCDEGRLGETEVLEVLEEVGVILHVTDGPLDIGAEVEGSIDRGRRWDLMQQHTGQHLLSRVLVDEYGSETRGFHLGDEDSTIDLTVELTEAELSLVQARANALIDADLAVTARFVDRDDPAVKAARRAPPDVDLVRLVEIGDIEAVPCGGTHLPSTLRIGGIHLLSGGANRAHGLFRISFICGDRIRRRLMELDRMAAALSRTLSTAPSEFADRVADLFEQNRDLQAEIGEMQRALIPLRVEALKDTAEAIGSARVVMARIDDLPPETLLPLAAALTGEPDVVALLGAGVADTGRLVFARGEAVDLDMSDLLKEAAGILGGGGGGQPDHATGGGPRGEALDVALTGALDSARAGLTAAS